MIPVRTRDAVEVLVVDVDVVVVVVLDDVVLLVVVVVDVVSIWTSSPTKSTLEKGTAVGILTSANSGGHGQDDHVTLAVKWKIKQPDLPVRSPEPMRRTKPRNLSPTLNLVPSALYFCLARHASRTANSP